MMAMVINDAKNRIDLLYFKVLKPFLPSSLSFFPRVSVMILPFPTLKDLPDCLCLLVCLTVYAAEILKIYIWIRGPVLPDLIAGKSAFV